MVLRCTEKAPWVYWSRILSTIAPPMGLVRSLPSAGPTKMPSLLMGAPFARLRALQASYGRSEARVSPERTDAGSIHRSAWQERSDVRSWLASSDAQKRLRY